MTSGRSRVDAPKRAVLVKRQRVDIGDVSRTGCRLEAAEPFAVGAVGMLAVNIGGEMHVEMFRVSRTGAVPGDDPLYEAGVEFLPMPADAASLQDVVVQFERADASS